MSVRNTLQVGHATAFVPHYFMPEGQFYAKRFLSVTGSHLWCCSDAMGLPASLLVRRPHCDRTIAPLGAEACQWLFSFPLAKCLTMRHPKLPKKLNNWLIINLGNLFVQKCDEVKWFAAICTVVSLFAKRRKVFVNSFNAKGLTLQLKTIIIFINHLPLQLWKKKRNSE